jgi:hypothetical protein
VERVGDGGDGLALVDEVAGIGMNVDEAAVVGAEPGLLVVAADDGAPRRPARSR